MRPDRRWAVATVDGVDTHTEPAAAALAWGAAADRAPAGRVVCLIVTDLPAERVA